MSAKECQCDLKTRLVGDGCQVCNPELASELAQASGSLAVGQMVKYRGLKCSIQELHETIPNAVMVFKRWVHVSEVEPVNAPTLARAGEDTAITDPLPTARCQQ